MPNVIIIGAGKIGKGFFGEVFHTAGWNISFVDCDPAVVAPLKEHGRYTVTVHAPTETIEHVVDGFSVYFPGEEALQPVVDGADLIFFALYPADIPTAIRQLVPMLQKRMAKDPDKKLTILSATNKNHLIPKFNDLFHQLLTGPGQSEWYDANVALRDVIIRRGTTAPSPASIDTIDTKAVASLLIQPPLYCDLSNVPWMELMDGIEQTKEIKLFTYNSTHVTCAFASHLKGYTTINEGMADSEIFDLVQQVLDESCKGLAAEYPVTPQELYDFTFPLRTKLAKVHIDYVFRVAYDPLRKMSFDDRLTGNARLCLKHGIHPAGLIRAIGYGLAYDHPDDPKAVALQKMVAEKGPKAALCEVTGLEEDHIIVKEALEVYNSIKK